MSARKRFCPQCGKENSAEAKFCKECGAAFESSEKPGWWGRQTRWAKLALVVAPLVLVAVIVGVVVGTTGGSGGPDLGKAEVVEPDPSSYVESETYGWAAADNVLVVMEDGLGRSEAEQVAAQLGGSVVGEIEFMNMYQIQTSGTTAEDLETSIAKAEVAPGVKWAVSNGLMVNTAFVQGQTCSPLLDPAYQSGQNYVPYEMIGMMEAVAIINASHPTLNPVRAGISDSPIYTDSGAGLATELYFPDAGGSYPDGKVHVRGLDAGDTTDVPHPTYEGGLTHGTAVAHVMAADWGEGVTGVASALGDRLTVTMNSHGGDPHFTWPADLTVDNLWETLAATDLDDYAAGSFGSSFVTLIELVKDDAKVINLSWARPGDPDPDKALAAIIYKDFFEKMYAAHDDVVFVAAAGNEGGALDGQNYAPGGIRGVGNLITVGALDREGDRANLDDWVPQEVRRPAYEARKAAGKLEPADQTFEDWVKSLGDGSNFAGPGGEVTISACGTDILVGREADDTPIVWNGTSFAAPQVAAAIALIKSIDPDLTGWQIKDLLRDTGDTEVTVSGSTVPVPESVGGRVLRVDKAVLKVINDLRGPGNELIYGDLIELETVELTVAEHEFGYLINATTPRVETPSGVDLRITVEGEAEIFGEETHRIYNNLETGSWTVSPGPDPVKVTVRRLDNGACAFVELPGTGAADSTTTTESATTTVGAASGQWTVSGSPVVNPEGLPLEYLGGGADPTWFPEPRFEGTWLKYRPSATSFAVDDRWVDHEFESYNVTLEWTFDAPPPVLVPGETYELTVNCSSSGSVVDGNPGGQFWYASDDVTISPSEVLAYYPWAPGFDGTNTKTFSFTVPEGSSGDTIEISASLWNAAQCWVVWTYTVE